MCTGLKKQVCVRLIIKVYKELPESYYSIQKRCWDLSPFTFGLLLDVEESYPQKFCSVWNMYVYIYIYWYVECNWWLVLAIAVCSVRRFIDIWVVMHAVFFKMGYWSFFWHGMCMEPFWLKSFRWKCVLCYWWVHVCVLKFCWIFIPGRICLPFHLSVFFISDVA